MKKKDKELLRALEGRLTVTKRVHPGFEEWNKLSSTTKRQVEGYVLADNRKKYFPPFGKWQYLYKNSKGEIISLINTKTLFNIGLSGRGRIWEIYCMKGKLFAGILRFATKKEAEETICNYLGEKL